MRARHDQVVQQLPDDPDRYAPILHTLPDGTVMADAWARGFQAGIGLHDREWAALFRNPKAKRFVVPITTQLPDWDDKIMADLGQAAVLDFRREGQKFLGYCAAEIGRFWAKRRQASASCRGAVRQPMLI